MIQLLKILKCQLVFQKRNSKLFQKHALEKMNMYRSEKAMNIFNMNDKEFEEYLKKNIETLKPEELLQELIDCGLSEEVDLYYSFDNEYTFENTLVDNSFDLTVHRTSIIKKFFSSKRSLDVQETMRRAA